MELGQYKPKWSCNSIVLLCMQNLFPPALLGFPVKFCQWKPYVSWGILVTRGGVLLVSLIEIQLPLRVPWGNLVCMLVNVWISNFSSKNSFWSIQSYDITSTLRCAHENWTKIQTKSHELYSYYCVHKRKFPEKPGSPRNKFPLQE